MDKAVFLDRDGVINKEKPGGYVNKKEDFILVPGAGAAIKRFKKLGYKVIVLTNQRGISLGHLTTKDLFEIHDKMREELKKLGAETDAVYFCPGEGVNRKPNVGMAMKAIRDFNLEPEKCIVIGDNLSDLMLAENIGCKSMLVKSSLSPVIVNNLLEASKIIEGEKL